MLDPIIISYKLTTIVWVTYYRIQQYPVKYIYNKWLLKLKNTYIFTRNHFVTRNWAMSGLEVVEKCFACFHRFLIHPWMLWKRSGKIFAVSPDREGEEVAEGGREFLLQGLTSWAKPKDCSRQVWNLAGNLSFGRRNLSLGVWNPTEIDTNSRFGRKDLHFGRENSSEIGDLRFFWRQN